ncbi:hypothetical protein DCC85_14400 [Paenibacillus sp. CAA11]|uniref:BRO-N domain-containing protein n=1 Tax=Paenibacillus sp. CAA11 TaxID=1532905 RepID=UPI000D37D765|nr:Bro-N domain-containing protein [Paenibacillus sp. CAA11]AWB45300.1 hypothetical protein DCC85_14400 [Paenibacillus sp. CAA11]
MGVSSIDTLGALAENGCPLLPAPSKPFLETLVVNTRQALFQPTPSPIHAQVRTVTVARESWFVAKDVCEVLGVGNTSQALSRLDADERNTIILNEGIRGNPNITIVNESGLYSLILTSRKPEARAFKRWVTHEGIPLICKTGGYVVNDKFVYLKSYPFL